MIWIFVRDEPSQSGYANLIETEANPAGREGSKGIIPGTRP